MIKTIGFFGDSFCAEVTNHHSLWNNYTSYMKLLSEHYNAKITNTGYGGTGVWDTLLVQLQPLIDSNQVPDVCVFVWTLPARIFHRKVRRLNHADTLNPKLHTYNIFQYKVWRAAKEYYTHLLDWKKENLEYVACLRYIDDVVLPKIADKKIVHLWSAGNTSDWSNEGIKPSNTSYVYTWKHGAEIRPSLLSLSLYDNDISILQQDHRCNHLDGRFKNETVFNWIKAAIDSPALYNYSDIIDKLYHKLPEADHPAI